MDDYYVYYIIDPRTSQPVYVGKGKNRRMYDHWVNRNNKNCNHLLKRKFKELEQEGLKPVYAKAWVNLSETEALDIECKLIAMHGRLDLSTGILCNLTDGGDGVSGWSDDLKAWKREQELAKNKGRPVSQYTLDGDFIATYPSAKRAAALVPEANRSYITQCCKGKRVSSGGFLWTYEGEDIKVVEYRDHKRVCQYDPVTGKLVHTHWSVTHAASSVGLDVRSISGACRGKTKHSGGFAWRYEGDIYHHDTNSDVRRKTRNVQQLTLEGILVNEYLSAADASRATGIGHTHILRVCSSKHCNKTAGGFIWRYS